jgi:hypothetical protein
VVAAAYHAAVAGLPDVGERIRLVAERLPERADAVITPYLAPSVPESSGVALLDIRWPPPGPGRERFRGAAVVTDDLGVRVLDLADRGDLAALLVLVWDLGPEAVAEVLARYGRRGPFDNLVRTAGDTGGALEPETALELGLRPPWRSAGPGGGDEVRFHTFHLRTAPPRGDAIRVGVDEWAAARSPDDEVEWRSRPLARELPSPRYAAVRR